MEAQEAHAGVRLGERAELAESDGRLAHTLASRPGPMSNDEIQALTKLLACGGSQPASLRLAWLCLLVSYMPLARYGNRCENSPNSVVRDRFYSPGEPLSYCETPRY